MKRRLTDAQHQEIAARHEAGESHSRIAQAFGCSWSNVNQICLKLGATPPNARPLTSTAPGPSQIVRGGRILRRFMPDEDARLSSMEADGQTDSAIGRALGRHPSSIRIRRMTLARHDARSEVA